MNEITKYQDELVIYTFDDKEIVVPASVREQLYRDIQNLKFVEINGELINTSSIKRISKKEKDVYEIIS